MFATHSLLHLTLHFSVPLVFLSSCIDCILRWYLGIQSKKDPANVMNEVYKAMHALNCIWHQVNNYRVLCRWKYTSGLPSRSVSSATAKSPALAALAALAPHERSPISAQHLAAMMDTTGSMTDPAGRAAGFQVRDDLR